MTGKDSTAHSAKDSSLPMVITVDTQPKDSEASVATKGPTTDSSSQARTPKHANKTKDDADDERMEHDHLKVKARDPNWPSYPAQDVYQQQGQGPNAPGAFQPRSRQSMPPAGLPPMQVSPGAGRYYDNYGGVQANRFAGPGPYQQRLPGDYTRFETHGYGYQQHRQFQSGYPPIYPGGAGSGWVVHGGQYQQGRPPQHPGDMYPRAGPSHTNNGMMSRAVSSSFDRSIKSREEKGPLHVENSPNMSGMPAPGDGGSVSEDASWRQLHQVQSVDEEELRKRVQKRTSSSASREVAIKQPESNSSSLTNSPTEGVESKKSLPDPAKLRSSLESLSSVASTQEPMVSVLKNDNKSSSPQESAGSLDLMKCASGSSALLLPSHQRSLSQFSFAGSDTAGHGKRSHDDEERGDIETMKESTAIRKAPSEDEPPTKKGRRDPKDQKKSSPLSITCSPPGSPSMDRRKGPSKLHQPQPLYPGKDPVSSFYDKPPSYSYSMESGPTIPREHGNRPGSSSSSTITPMHVEMRPPPAVGQLPSWEIHGQDSFGGGSTSNALMSSFSFQQDYPTLGQSASMDQGLHGPRGSGVQELEGRNPSFDAGQYPGTFNRSDSMMSYESRQPGPAGYQGQFPPHAPSWGSAGSYPAHPPHFAQYRQPYPTMMRNFSEDSAMQASPPGSTGMRMAIPPPQFQPPADFRVPPSMLNKGMQRNTILTSPYAGGQGMKQGSKSSSVNAFGWSKDEDEKLSNIMKKYKNPRDWEPISKEHGFSRTAKECHERWIRYLKPGVRKGQWTDHEDAIVMEVVTNSQEQPFTRWSDLAQRLPGRVGKQIRDRWVNHLNPAINHLPFSRDDDLLLWEGHKQLGKRWVEIATKYFNSTRSENHIKNRWYSASFKKFISNEFGAEAYNGGKEKKESPDKKRKKPSSPKKGSVM